MPLYIVHTLAEAALKPRHVQRISEHLRLPYEQLADADTNPKPELSHCTRLLMLNAPPREVFWPKSLSGLYLLLPDSPKVNHDWSPPPSSPHRLPLLIGQTHKYVSGLSCHFSRSSFLVDWKTESFCLGSFFGFVDHFITAY